MIILIFFQVELSKKIDKYRYKTQVKDKRSFYLGCAITKHRFSNRRRGKAIFFQSHKENNSDQIEVNIANKEGTVPVIKMLARSYTMKQSE